MDADLLAELVNFLPLAAVLVLTGCIAGVLAGLLGVGGGIVVVPVLFTMLGLIDIDDSVRMHVAVGTSLASIVLTSFVSARSHDRKGAVDLGLLKSWGPWVFAGAVGGALIAGSVGGAALRAVFAGVTLIVGLYMAFAPRGWTVREGLPKGAAGGGAGLAVGGFSAMMGIGGGTLCVPYFSVFGMPVHRAVGTAAAVGLIIAVPAATGFIVSGWGEPALPRLSVGHVNLLGLVLIAPFTTLTAPLGVRLAHFLSPRALRLAFAGFLFATGARMIWSLL